MNRRNFITGLALATSAPWAMAIDARGLAGEQSAHEPFTTLDAAIRADAQNVVLIISYSCPFCMRYHEGLVNWARSLPPPFRHRVAPVITSENDSESLLWLYGRDILQRYAPERLGAYDAEGYRQVQGGGDVTPDAVVQALRAQGVSDAQIQARAEEQDQQGWLRQYIDPLRQYSVKATPSIGLFGRYVVTPDNANGDPQQFYMLLNGIVSRQIEVMRNVS